jgi:hypothetical protein
MDITVDVSIESTGPPPEATYKSSNDPAVTTEGDITVDAGEDANITFNIAPDSPNQPWSFVYPWVTIVPDAGSPTGPVLGPDPQATAVVIVDDNPNHGGQDYQYNYTLYTTWGALDPRIINKPTG